MGKIHITVTDDYGKGFFVSDENITVETNPEVLARHLADYAKMENAKMKSWRSPKPDAPRTDLETNVEFNKKERRITINGSEVRVLAKSIKIEDPGEEREQRVHLTLLPDTVTVVEDY